MASLYNGIKNTAAGFASTNPVIADGWYAYETDTGFMKIGNGVQPWASLPYANLLDPLRGSHVYTNDANGNVLTDAWTLNGVTRTRTFTYDANSFLTAVSDWG